MYQTGQLAGPFLMGRTPECRGRTDAQERRDGQDARMPQAHGCAGAAARLDALFRGALSSTVGRPLGSGFGDLIFLLRISQLATWHGCC
jgi:hypothetical protein